MSKGYRGSGSREESDETVPEGELAPGRRTLTSRLRSPNVAAKPEPVTSELPEAERAVWRNKFGVELGGGGTSPKIVDDAVAAGGGSPVPAGIREAVEPHVGADLSQARVHSDDRAHAASASIGARAFTYGSDVFLGKGESASDLPLMAHELTHVVQQGAAKQQGPQALAVGAADHPAEKEADAVAAKAAGGAPVPGAKLVDQNVQPQPGQMTRNDFLLKLRPLVMAAADLELGKAGATVGCPYIDQWFAHFANEPAAHVERVAQRFSGRADVPTALDYIQPIIDRLRLGVRRWNRGDNVNQDLEAAGIAGANVPQRPQGILGTGLGAQRTPTAGVIDRLGPGERIDPGVASRIGGALDQDVSGVRVHTDQTAARLASQMDAAAFTVGQHVAFGANTYQPGTPRGDALLAHELAHVVQQKRAEDEESGDSAPPDNDRELAQAARATESESHEADADKAGASAVRRLYSGTKSVMGSIGPVLTSDVQLQRCPSVEYEKMPEPPAPAVDPHLPMPTTVGFAGDKFEISFEGKAPNFSFIIHYVGPHRTNRASDQNKVRLDLTLTEKQFTGVGALPYNAAVTQITEEGITVDLLGDHTRLAVLTDRVRPGFYMESRSHSFEAAITSGNWTAASMDVEWYVDSGVGKPPAPNATTDPSIVSTTVNLAGAPIALHAQRFGNTKKVQLRFDADAIDEADEMVSFDQLDHVTLTILRNTGRDLHIDLNGDKKPDALIVHTAEDTPAGERLHHLRTFTTDGILLKDHRVYSKAKTPIPADQDERTHKPDTSLEWPANRPPGQADIPGQLPVPIDRPGGITELRVDSDGDRHKDVVLRFHPDAPPDPDGNVSKVRIDVAQLSSGQSASQHLDISAHPGPIRPVVRDVADGLQPLVVQVTRPYGGGTDVEMKMPTPIDKGGRRSYTIQALGQTLTYDLPAEVAPTATLAQARPDGAVNPSGVIGNVWYVDLLVGEQGDQFRFTAEQTETVGRFAVAGLAGGMPFTGGGVSLIPGTKVTGLKVLAGDPRQIAFDVNNDGVADVLINDRFSQPTRAVGGPNMAEPVDVGRQHIMTIHGPKIAGLHEHPFFIFAGRWYQRYGFGSTADDREAAGSTTAVSELTRQRGEGADVKGLISHFEQAVATQRFDAIRLGVITKELYDAWNALFTSLTALRPAVIPTPPQAPTTPDANLVKTTADQAATFIKLLQAATAGHGNTDERYRDGVHSRRDAKRTNKYTGEIDDMADVYEHQEGRGGTVLKRSGAPVELEGDIRGGNWVRAYQNYTTMRDGLDLWIADSMAAKYGPNQSASWQLDMLRGIQKIDKEHSGVRRVQAVFVADNSYSNHSDYNSYKELPLYLLIWREGTRWQLRDLTKNASSPYEQHDDGGDAKNPSPDLFGNLDDKHEFPKGVIRFDIPGGYSGRVKTTEKKTWVDYASEAAMILGAIALAATGVGAIAEAAGATIATVAAFQTISASATIAAGVVGTTAAIGDLVERARHGDLDALTAVIDFGQIIANVFTVGAVTSKIIVNAARAADLGAETAAWTGNAARAALVADHLYIPMLGIAAAGDVVTVAAMSAQTVQQIMAIKDGPGSKEDRERAIMLLLGNLFAMGALTAMSVHGSFTEIRAGRPNIVVDMIGNIPVARAAGVSIGGKEIHVSSARPDDHASARWNAHALEEAAHEGNAGAKTLTGDEEFMKWYRAWMEQPQRVRFGADGRAEVVPFKLNGVDLPEPMRQRMQTYLDTPQNALSLYERSYINGERIRQLQTEIPGLDLNPASQSWQTNRARVIQALGGDAAAAAQVRRYESAILGAAAANPARYAAEHAGLTQIVPQTELDQVRALYNGYEVYVTGTAPRERAAGVQPPDIPDLDIFVVVPAGTKPEVMQAMEARAQGFRVHTDPDFNTQHGKPAGYSIPLDAKVMTPDQFLGFATTVVPPLPGQRARTPASYHSLTATAAAAPGSRQASAQVATRVMADEAAGDRLLTALGTDHGKLAGVAAAIGDAQTRRMVTALGDERFARYAAVTDGATIHAMVDGFPDAQLRLLEARITPQQIADTWRGGGAHALRMAETLTQPELVRIMGSLGGERFGRYASVPGVDGALLGRMTMAIPDATLRIVEPRLTPEGVVRIFNASGAGGIDAVNGAITLEANGRLKGLNDWITFAAAKAPPDLARTVGELPEAQRLAAANPTSIINIGGDQRAPVRADGTAMRSFDITIENPAGAVSRSVEVTTVDGRVAQMGDVTGGVQHAIDKVVSRAADGAPIPGAHDVTIRINLDVGRRPIAGGRAREISTAGEVRIIDGDGVFRARRGNPSNLFDDIGGNLGRIGNNATLDRVTIVNAADGTVHAVYDRTAAGWTRVQ